MFLVNSSLIKEMIYIYIYAELPDNCLDELKT